MKLTLTILSLFILLSVSGQTVNDLRPTVTMKEYVDMQSELNRQLNEAQFINFKDNITKATASMDKRLDGMNEFRDTLKDQAGTFITRSELIAWIGMAAALFWGWSRHSREKRESEAKSILSGDKVEVKK